LLAERTSIRGVPLSYIAVNLLDKHHYKEKLSKMESIKVLTWISVIARIRYAPRRDFRAAAPHPHHGQNEIQKKKIQTR
jgi:hypothetical protein